MQCDAERAGPQNADAEYVDIAYYSMPSIIRPPENERIMNE
jgi:hypothetical protein